MTDRVAVIGAGLMGHGLAQVFAVAGHPVAVQDPSPDALASVRDRIAGNLTTLGRDPAEAGRVDTYSDIGAAVEGAAWVIEAAPEDLDLKRSIFEELERVAAPNAVLATNTSVIPVTSIAERVASAERVVGTHWWNPPYLVPLVEVVQAERTSSETVERTLGFLESVGKSPVHVRRDVPGFVGNRLQHALWREAIALVAEGVCDADTVDKVVMQGFGKRLAVMGPLETAELVGLDLTLAIHEHVLPDIDATRGPSPYLRDLVERGDLGMKTGRGFREWSPDDPARARERLTRHLTDAPATEGDE